MKSLFSRSLFVAFLVVTGLTYSYAQTTVNLPTIPCSTCNGPGAFATTAPACTSGLLGAPLTMSWGAASGATSYTILIATDAALTQDLATYTLSGTTLSVPAYALKPSVTYYWTVVANNATGSTKATGGVCTFSTNNTWMGTSPTGGFPNGTGPDIKLNDGVAGGYYDCRSGDGTCASGDNLICNPKFVQISSASPYVPDWMYARETTSVSLVYPGQSGVNLAAAGAGLPGSGTTTGMKMVTNGSTSGAFAVQLMYGRNLTSSVQNYRVSFWAKLATSTPTNLYAAFQNSATPVENPQGYSSMATTYGYAGYGTGLWYASTAISSSWTKYDLNVAIPGSSSFTHFQLETDTGYGVYVTDVVVCKL